ncbi:ISL3 family transposase [Jeotgalibacillus malaysiensis]|uniref:ISL3 family transposase n=1 Tax=Jeotgalibacillus malaysiensis TaxID=1508404 RepID=UPI00384E6241
MCTHLNKPHDFLPIHFSVFPTVQPNVVRVETSPQSILCPECHGPTHRHGLLPRMVRHSYSFHAGVIWLSIDVLRLRCPDCELTFTHDFELGLQRKSTFFFRKSIVDRCHGRPLSQGAKEYDIAYTTLERWYYLMTAEDVKARIRSAKRICVDEFALRKGHYYAIAALDADTGQVLYIETGRNKETVESVLNAIGQKAQTVITDTAAFMAKAIQTVLPEAEHVLDRFHLIQFCTEALRRRRKYLIEAKSHFKSRFIDRCLSIPPEDLTEEEQGFVREWLEEDWHTKTLYYFLQHVRFVLKSNQFIQAKRRFDELIHRFRFHSCGAVAKIIKTYTQRYEAFLDTIISPYSNGIMEGTNNKIKLIKRRGYGYRNEQNLFHRICLETGSHGFW